MKMKSILPIMTACMSLPAFGSVTLPSMFSDNMVIQADTTIAVWGKAPAGALVKASGSWGAEATATAGSNGRWRMALASPAASFEPLTIAFTESTAPSDTLRLSNVLAGEVWFASGQSNMEMPLRGFRHQPVEGGGEQIAFSRKLGRGVRFINVPKAAAYEPADDVKARWVVSDPADAGEFSAVAWFFATALRDILDTPVGIINCAYGGSKLEGWEPAEIIARYPDRNLEAERLDPTINEWERVGVMYNAMLRPFAGYTLRGFLWNQGESNIGDYDRYPARQADMLNHWRELWGNPRMPFYFVEMPSWSYSGNDLTYAALFREAQLKAADTTPGAWMVSTVDLVYDDEADDVHARNKRPIGQRLAWLAATHTYGLRGLPHTFPRYRSMKVDGNSAELTFDNAWSGFTPNDELEGFEAAGSDRVFRPARAVINRDGLTITVTSPTGEPIEAVRYCFRNFKPGKIHDLLGMPLIPFRTDNWPE